MQNPNDNGPQPAGEVTPQPTGFTTTVEIISTPGGPVLRMTFKTVTGQTVLFATPSDGSTIAELISSRVAIANRALLLPPGTVVPVPDEPERN
jgi:hypothetical protein